MDVPFLFHFQEGRQSPRRQAELRNSPSRMDRQREVLLRKKTWMQCLIHSTIYGDGTGTAFRQTRNSSNSGWHKKSFKVYVLLCDIEHQYWTAGGKGLIPRLNYWIGALSIILRHHDGILSVVQNLWNMNKWNLCIFVFLHEESESTCCLGERMANTYGGSVVQSTLL